MAPKQRARIHLLPCSREASAGWDDPSAASQANLEALHRSQALFTVQQPWNSKSDFQQKHKSNSKRSFVSLRLTGDVCGNHTMSDCETWNSVKLEWLGSADPCSADLNMKHADKDWLWIKVVLSDLYQLKLSLQWDPPQTSHKHKMPSEPMWSVSFMTHWSNSTAINASMTHSVARLVHFLQAILPIFFFNLFHIFRRSPCLLGKTTSQSDLSPTYLVTQPECSVYYRTERPSRSLQPSRKQRGFRCDSLWVAALAPSQTEKQKGL